jgi:hypothetical protein
MIRRVVAHDPANDTYPVILIICAAYISRLILSFYIRIPYTFQNKTPMSSYLI